MAKRGGKRPGAGRKATPLSRSAKPSIGLKRATAEEILASIDEHQFWADLLNAVTYVSGGKDRPPIEVPDLRLRFDAGRYLRDHRDGKAAQAVDMTHKGGITLIHSVPRPERTA